MVKVVQHIDEFNAFFKQQTLHPFVGVGKLEDADLSLFSPLDFDMYCIVLMDEHFGELIKSGRGVQYKPGTIFWLRPGQVVSMNLSPNTKPKGLMLAFRPELLVKAGLGRDFYMFNYFNHDFIDALELTSEERLHIIRAFDTILTELQTPVDNLTDHMIRLSIGHLLSYVKRFYDRLYANQKRNNSDLIQRLNAILDDYLSSGKPIHKGQPTVSWCAEQFNLSPNYFGDMVKRELQMTAQEFIQDKIIDLAKVMLEDSNLNISDIAKSLGFAYANHFTRLFNKKVGISPTLYRKQKID